MTETQIIKTEEIFKVDISRLDAFQDAKNKQVKLVEDCPYTGVTDNKTYEVAKKYRTTLRTGRTDLEKGKKLIISTLNNFKKRVDDYTAELIEITRPAEDRQQQEITRYEEEKEAERKRKEEEERQRKEAIKQSIANFRDRSNQAIATATFNTIAGIQKDISETTLECAEFQDDFEAIKNDLTRSVEAKREQLQREEYIRQQQAEIKRNTTRSIELKKWGYIYPGDDLGRLPEEEFINLRDEQRKIFMDEQAAKAKAEEDRKRIEREQQEKEAELVRKEAALKAEEERIEREENEKRLKAEREAQATREAEELQLKKEAEAKAKAEMEERERARQEALKPDKQKIVETLTNLTLPEPALASPEMQEQWDMVRESFRCFVIEQVTIINNL